MSSSKRNRLNKEEEKERPSSSLRFGEDPYRYLSVCDILKPPSSSRGTVGSRQHVNLAALAVVAAAPVATRGSDDVISLTVTDDFKHELQVRVFGPRGTLPDVSLSAPMYVRLHRGWRTDLKRNEQTETIFATKIGRQDTSWESSFLFASFDGSILAASSVGYTPVNWAVFSHLVEVWRAHNQCGGDPANPKRHRAEGSTA
jgi:hypothetical protein